MNKNIMNVLVIGNKVDMKAPLNNHHIKLFYDLSQYIHKSYTSGGNTWNAVKFLWSPFYPLSYSVEDQVNAMGAVTNKLDIFDDVIIQVGYYENGPKYNFMNYIKQGTYKKALMDIQKSDPTIIVGTNKTSQTKIGVQMEFSNQIDKDHYVSEDDKYNPQKEARYYETEKCFNNETYKINGYNKENYLFSYYMDQKPSNPDILSRNQAIVRKFFGVVPFKDSKQ